MSILFMSAALLLSAPTTISAPDQSSDARFLLTFVEAVKRGSYQEAQAMLAPGAFIGDYDQKQATSFAEFADYARACQLRQVNVVAGVGDRRMPMGVKWLCSAPTYERDASFWFEGEKISRIGWGKPLVIRVPPVRSR